MGQVESQEVIKLVATAMGHTMQVLAAKNPDYAAALKQRMDELVRNRLSMIAGIRRLVCDLSPNPAVAVGQLTEVRHWFLPHKNDAIDLLIDGGNKEIVLGLIASLRSLYATVRTLFENDLRACIGRAHDYKTIAGTVLSYAMTPNKRDMFTSARNLRLYRRCDTWLSFVRSLGPNPFASAHENTRTLPWTQRRIVLREARRVFGATLADLIPLLSYDRFDGDFEMIRWIPRLFGAPDIFTIEGALRLDTRAGLEFLTCVMDVKRYTDERVKQVQLLTDRETVVELPYLLHPILAVASSDVDYEWIFDWLRPTDRDILLATCHAHIKFYERLFVTRYLAWDTKQKKAAYELRHAHT